VISIKRLLTNKFLILACDLKYNQQQH